MRLNVMLEPQLGLSYADILAAARRTAELGFAGLFRSDHYSSTGGGGLGSTDAWATLAGLAREIDGIQLGTCVSPATFRPAGNLAKVVATVAEMAGSNADGSSRIELGMGTGWLESEHREYGFAFGDQDTRYRRLEEHLHIVRGLWAGPQPFDFAGEFEHLQQAKLLPTPNPRPRLLVGGSGMRRTPRLAAAYADELNGVFLSPEDAGIQRASLHQACQAAGRDPSTVGYSLMTGCLIGATQHEFLQRVRRLIEWSESEQPAEQWVAERRDVWILGTPDRAADHLGRLADAGVERVMLQVLLADDLDMLALVAQDVAPRL